MSPIIDEHTDELEARRQRRETRRGTPATNGETPAGGRSAGAARDLLHGLITDGAPRNDRRSATVQQDSGDERAALSSSDSDASLGAKSAPISRRQGEKIDELIRRVKESSSGATEASSTLEQRRPKGTADLSRDAAADRAAARRSTSEPGRRRPDAARVHKKHRWVLVATVLLAGIAIVLVTLVGTGGTSVPVSVDASMGSSRLAAVRPGGLGGALQSTMAAIVPALRAVGHQAATSARLAHTRHDAPRHAIDSRARRARSTHRAATVHRVAVPKSAPPSSTGAETQTHAPVPATASTASQTSATSQPSATSSSRPTGPTGSDSLGGIGSCVKGC